MQSPLKWKDLGIVLNLWQQQAGLFPWKENRDMEVGVGAATQVLPHW